MNDDLIEKVTSFSERLMVSSVDVGKKVSAGMSSLSFKMMGFFQGPNQADMIVAEATAESMEVPDWTTNLEICDMINNERINSVELIRSVKRRIAIKSPRVQYFALVLLETVVQNCDRAFSEVAGEKVLDEMVKLIDDPQTAVNNRKKALFMIQVWGESSDELRYLPVYEETYKNLRMRGIRFPGRDTDSRVPNFTPAPATSEPVTRAGFQERASPVLPTFSPELVKEAFNVARNSIELLSTVLSSSPHQDVLKDDLTTALVQQCRSSRSTIQRIIATAGENEALLFEALNLNDEVQKALSKFKDLKRASVTTNNTTQLEPEPAMIPVTVQPKGDQEMMDDLDEMIFGTKSGSVSEDGSEQPKKKQSGQDDLISF